MLLLSAPRSGSTWLGKIFDSHPDILYRHEPDTVLRIEPALARGTPEDLRLYVRALRDLRDLKSAAHTPIFAKSYRGAAPGAARTGLIHALRAAERLPLLGRAARQVAVPEWRRVAPALTVIKSVSGCRYAGAYRAALPRAQILLLMREPIGQIASMLQGDKERRLDARAAAAGLWAWPLAERYGLTSYNFGRLSLPEQLAWHWVLSNETALDGLAGQPGTMLLHYHDLTADPESYAKGLFHVAGLNWPAQTRDFIARSTQHAGREGFYQVYRNSNRPERALRSLLPPDDRARITEIVQRSTLARWAMADFRTLQAAT